ncbi:hypothetical protein CYY_005269 [Polysphondylium violaceum]|uniref:Glycophosphotransferase n=1 Tax=Polysphondylium violaceum TaxID=133409 RepID=A0A8J4Q3H6_9MYCE|nr:hypothetical protein CYY_005269 [Polysphondylium violaceum]
MANLNIKPFLVANKATLCLVFVFIIFSLNYLVFQSSISKAMSTTTHPSIKLQRSANISINTYGYVLHREANSVTKSTILNRNCTHIDAVYTWVNGSDPTILDKLKKAGYDINEDKERYREIGALKYSLRSVYQNAPWIKNIWILTDSQIPDFFDVQKDVPNIKFIFHESFFENRTHLPTFNSLSIESNFYNLPEEVSNCFLYFNDDVFLKSPVQPIDFFDANYNQVIFESDSIIGLYVYRLFNELDPYFQSMVLSGQLLDKIWSSVEDERERVQSDHGVQVFNRKMLLQMQFEIGQELAEASSHKKRETSDPQLAFIYNQFVKRYDINYRVKKNFSYYGAITTNATELNSTLDGVHKTSSKVVCLNDRLNSNDTLLYNQIVHQLVEFYDHILPHPAPWEKKY